MPFRRPTVHCFNKVSMNNVICILEIVTAVRYVTKTF